MNEPQRQTEGELVELPLNEEVAQTAREELTLRGVDPDLMAAVAKDAIDLEAEAEALTGILRIDDAADLEYCQKLHARAVERLAQADEVLGDVKRLTNQAHKAACGAYNKVTAIPKAVKAHAGRLLADYQAREERRLELEAKERQAEAEKLVAEEALEEAAALETAGDTEAATEILERAADPVTREELVPIVTAAAPPKISGLDTFTHWSVRDFVLDAPDSWREVLEKIVEGDDSLKPIVEPLAMALRKVVGVEPRYLLPDVKKLRQLAKAEKDAARVRKLAGPGVPVFSEKRSKAGRS